MYGLAFVFGPAVGGMLMRRGNLWVTVQVALAATVLNVLVLILLPEPPRNSKDLSATAETGAGAGEGAAAGARAGVGKEKRTVEQQPEGANGEKRSPQGFWGLMRQSGTAGGAGTTVAVLLARKLCTAFASGLFETTLAEYCARHLGLDGHVLGLLFSYLGV
jgi:hypothetical protein